MVMGLAILLLSHFFRISRVFNSNNFIFWLIILLKNIYMNKQTNYYKIFKKKKKNDSYYLKKLSIINKNH